MHGERLHYRPTLTLQACTTFWSRLCGLHGCSPLSEHHGLYMAPCSAIHTFGLPVPIDVVFLDRQLNELKRVDSVKPNRVVGCWGAKGVVELPAGYCQRHTDYLSQIRSAVRCT